MRCNFAGLFHEIDRAASGAHRDNGKCFFFTKRFIVRQGRFSFGLFFLVRIILLGGGVFFLFLFLLGFRTLSAFSLVDGVVIIRERIFYDSLFFLLLIQDLVFGIGGILLGIDSRGLEGRHNHGGNKENDRHQTEYSSLCEAFFRHTITPVFFKDIVCTKKKITRQLSIQY